MCTQTQVGALTVWQIESVFSPPSPPPRNPPAPRPQPPKRSPPPPVRRPPPPPVRRPPPPRPAPRPPPPVRRPPPPTPVVRRSPPPPAPRRPPPQKETPRPPPPKRSPPPGKTASPPQPKQSLQPPPRCALSSALLPGCQPLSPVCQLERLAALQSAIAAVVFASSWGEQKRFINQGYQYLPCHESLAAGQSMQLCRPAHPQSASRR
jgi:hypothetical protein